MYVFLIMWRDDMEAFIRTWPNMVSRREDWKALGETIAQQWDSKS